MIDVSESLTNVQRVWDSAFMKTGHVLESEKIVLEDGSCWWAKITGPNAQEIVATHLEHNDFNLGFYNAKTNQRIMMHIHPDKHNRQWHLQSETNNRWFLQGIVSANLCKSSTEIVKQIVDKINSEEE